MTLKDHYLKKRNERAEFVKELAAATGKSQRMIKYYISGKFSPPEVTKEIIAEYLKSNTISLFPDASKN